MDKEKTVDLVREVLCLLCISALLASCGGGSIAPPSPDTASPTVSDVRYSGALGTDNLQIIVAYNEPLDNAIVDSSTLVLKDVEGRVIPGVTGYAESGIRFQTVAPLVSPGWYSATIPAGLKDLAGNTVAEDHSWRFSIGPSGPGAWAGVSADGAPPAASGGTICSWTTVWTGAEMIVWGTHMFSGANFGGRYEPATDSWRPMSLEGAPPPAIGLSAIWTGHEMIVWGGADVRTGDTVNAGGRYDPVTDAWRSMSAVNAPRGRKGHAVVWTGREMVVWGGLNSTSGDYGWGNERLDTGGRYDPVADAWRATSLDSAPSARTGHSGVWSGSEMIVWGGESWAGSVLGAVNTGGRYDPATDSWRSVPVQGDVPGRSGHGAVWTGREMIVWGGGDATGSRYDPASGKWRPLSVAGAPSPRVGFSTVWTGMQMIVWGGWDPPPGPGWVTTSPSPSLDTGGRYDPTIDTWVATTLTGVPADRDGQSAVWTGAEVIVWGKGWESGAAGVAGRYTP